MIFHENVVLKKRHVTNSSNFVHLPTLHRSMFLTLTSLRGHRYSSISISDSSFDDSSGFGFHRGYSTICTPRARALVGRSVQLLEHRTPLFGLSIQPSNLSTDCDELERLACVSPVCSHCSLADTDMSVNIPESELTTTGLLSDVVVPELFAKPKNLLLTVDESLTSDAVDVELATRSGHDHGNENVAE